jgi:TP901 family phage tail tape measure protein
LADVNSNININFNTAAALAQLRQLQAGLSRFHQSLAEGNLAAANAQKGLNAQLLQSIGASGKFSASQVKVAGSTLAFTSALEKNKLSLREYYRYTMAAATANTRVMGKAFAQEREIINRARRDRVKALQAQYIQMNKANSGFMDAIRIMPKSLQMASGKFTELGTRIQYAAQRQQLLNQLLKQGSTQLLNFGKNTQWAGRQLMVGLTMPLALFGASAAKTFRELEAEIVKFKRVYGNAFTNDAETDAAVENIRRLATEYTKYGVSVTKTVEMAATAAAAGFQGSALNAQVETATKLAVLGQIEQQQALETTISLQSAFGISSEELAKKIDFLNAVENQTLLSIEDLTIAIPKAAPVVKQLGGSVEDLAFFLTAMKEGGINASEGANALKSGLAALINPSTKASAFLADLGINIKAIVEGNSGDIKATVVGFAEALDTLDPLNRARAIEQMFGKFQFSRLSTLFQNVTKDGSQASRAFDLAGKSIEELAILSEREMKKIEDSVGVKFQAAVEQFKQDIMPLGKVFLEALTPVVQFFGTLFEKFNGLSDSTKKVIAIIVGAVAGLGPILLMTFGLLANGIANVIKFFAMLRGGIAKLNGQTSVMGAGFNYMTQEQIENAASSQQLHQTHTRLIEVFNVEKGSVNALASSYNSLSTQMRAMASQNPALFAGGMGGAKRAVGKLPPVKKYKDGILTVPGPKGAGDIQPAMLAPGEAVIPTKITDKYRGLISAMFNDKVPGFMAGRIPLGRASYSTNDLIMQKVKRPAYPGAHPEKQSGSKFVGMPTSAAEASQSRQILNKISDGVKSSSYGTMPPSDFGTLLQSFSGRSFPARGVGGVYRKPNGQLVVVKPTIDEKTALAEVRATEIAREVHGLISPKQTIKTMMDPTDATGQRKFIVIESPYDSRIASTSGKFSKSDMVKQLVASTLRGDKDLQRPNLSGNVLADVGTAGVFDRASGFRDFAKAMPSMEQQAVVNLLGVKGGAKKFFAQETSATAASMTPREYDAAIKAEINKSIPRLEKVIKSFNLNPEEQVVYGNMLKRLKAGEKTDWSKLHPMHARAGEGIAKLELGDFEKFKNVPESKAQIERLVQGLSNDAALELERLPQEQKDKVIAAINKQKPKPTHMSQQRMIKFVEENMVYKDGLFHDKKSLDAGSTTSGKTYQEVMKKVFYQMGLQQKDGSFVSDKKINVPSKLKDAMSTINKAGGGWRTNVPRNSLLWKTLDAEEKSFRAANIASGKNDPLKVVREKLSSLGYNEKQIATALRSELSHIEKTGQSGRGPAKYLMGSAGFDLRLLNNYMNTKSRPQNILDWNNKNGNPLGLNSIQLKEFSKAADYMKPGAHPTNLDDIKLVQKSAQLDVLADDYLKQQKTKPKGFPKLGQVNASKGLLALLDDRIGTGYYDTSRPVFNLASGPDQSQKVLVDPNNEFKVDTNTGKITKLTNANTGAKPAGAVASSGSSRDRRTTTETKTQRVATRSQVRSFRRGFAMPGRIDGNPGLQNPTVRQGKLAAELRSKGLSQSEIDRTLRKFAQRDLKAKETQAKLSEKAARTEVARQREQANIQKRQTDAARKAFVESQRRTALNLEQTRNYDAAVKEDQQRTLKNLKQTQKQQVKQQRMARQQRIGGVSGGASMALGMAGSGAMMSGNMGVGMGLMGASAVAGMAPMLAGMGPVGLAITGIAAVGAGLFLLNKNLENAAKKQAKYVDSVSATTEKMDEIGQITGKVGASRVMDEVRKKGSFGAYNDVERAGTGFGDTFLRSEVGKSMATAFVDQMKTSGSATAAQDFALQLSTYVSDGVLDASQAADIADQIGIQLGSRKYTAEIMGNLRSVIGPNGEDLARDPLRVRTRIVEESNRRSDKIANSGNVGRTEAAQLGALAANNISIAKAQADATEFQYRAQIQLLEKELESTTNAEKLLSIKEKLAALEGKQAADLVVANKTYSNQIEREVKRFKNIRPEGATLRQLAAAPEQEKAYFTSLKSKITDRYKDSEFASMSTEVTNSLDSLDPNQMGGVLKAQDFKLRMSLMLADGTLNPEQLKTFMAMFQGKLPELDEVLSIGIRTHGPGATVEILEYFSGFEDEEGKVKELATKIVKSNPAEFKEIGETLAVLRTLDGHEINMEAYVTTAGYEGLLALSKDLAKIEAMPKKIDKELILKYFTTGKGTGVAGTSKENLEILFAQWKDFDKLPDKAQKEAISKFTTIYSTMFADEESRRKYAEEQRDALPNIAYISSEANKAIKQKRYDEIMKGTVAEAGKREASNISGDVHTIIGENGELVPSTLGAVDNTIGSGSKVDPLAFLGPLAMGLKQVRDGAFNALDPIGSLLQALKDKKTQTGAFALFDGIQDRLGALGVEQGFRDAISSLSATEFEAIANLPKDQALFTFEKGKPKTKDTIKGLTTKGEAANEGYKALRAGRVKDKAKLANEDFAMYKDMPNLVSQMKTLGYSSDQINEALADPELAKFLVDDLADGALDAEFIADYLNNIKERKIIDIQVKLNQGDLAAAAEPGQRIIDDLFAAQEGLIDTGQKATDIFKNDLEISALDLEIAPFLEQVKIISEEVNDLNRELEMNPLFGDRAIKTIQDENSSLSNDLTIISKAAEEVNKRYDDQAEALQKVSDINQNILQQQKQQIDLADAITSGDISAAARAVQEIRAANAARFADAQSKALQQARENELGSLTARPGGYTQEQISNKMYENSKKIYEMETDTRRLDIIKEIQKKQDAIYKIEEESIEPRQFQIDALTLTNTLLQGAIDLEKAELKALGLTRGEWEKINGEIAAYTAAKAAVEGSEDLKGLFGAIDKTKKDKTNTDKTIDNFAEQTPAQLLAALAAAKAETVRLATEAELKVIRDQYMLDLGSYSSGGMVPKYFAAGGYSRGTDTVPAMLTPGEFVMSKYAVDKYGVENMKSINSGSAIGDSVYNYNLNLNVKSDANPDDIARAVMVQIKSVDAQRIRGTRI